MSTLKTRFVLASALYGFFLLLMLFSIVGQAHGATIQLCTFLQAGGTVNLNAGNTYQLPGPGDCLLSESVTVNGNGVSISGVGPLHTSGTGVTLTVNNFLFQSSGWAALAASDGSQIVVQNNSTISCPGGSAIFAGGPLSSTITVQSSSITSSLYGVNLTNPSTGTLHGTTITGCPSAVQVDGASSSVTIDGNSSLQYTGGGTGVAILGGASGVIQNSTLSDFNIGVNIGIGAPSTGALHGVTITGCPYAVLVTAVSSSVTIDGNSLLDYTTCSSGCAGVGILNGASGVVHDSTLRGFLNAIDIQATGGTAEVVNCTFENNGSSALSAIYAQNVLFSGCIVKNAVYDGIYFNHSTGVIEKSQVIGSLNTGVAFLGCSNGATIRDSLVKDSAHQGVAIVADSTPPVTPNLNIQVLNNTFINNQIANLLIDATSTAELQGNIFSQTPDANIRFWGPQGLTLDSALIVDSSSGMEIKMSSNPKITLSSIMGNDKNGILVYDNSFLTAEDSIFWDNGLLATGGTSDSYSIFVNTGAKVNAHRCTFGPAGKWAFYNNTTNSCDVSYDYWAASDGPTVASWILIPPNGSGAHLDSSYIPLGPVTYTPFLTQPPVDSSVKLNVSLPSGGSLTWNSQLGVTLGLTAKPNSTALNEEIAGVLRVNDTASLNLVTPPEYLLPSQLYVVWVSTPLRSNSASGSLKFSVPSQEGSVELKRREINGSWTSVPSVWDSNLHILTYSPSDVYLLNGTFALTSVPMMSYVKKDGRCAGKSPCSASIQNGIDSAQTFTIINITQETYDENVILDDPKVLTLKGGWDSTFTTNPAKTAINGSLTISDGKLIVENISLE